MSADRNGFFYVLDRTNGKFISATPFVSKQTWASGAFGGIFNEEAIWAIPTYLDSRYEE